MLVTEALLIAGLTRGIQSSVLQNGFAQENVIDPIPLRHMKDGLVDIRSVFTLVRVTGAAGLNPLTVSVSLSSILLTRNAGCLID